MKKALLEKDAERSKKRTASVSRRSGGSRNRGGKEASSGFSKRGDRNDPLNGKL
jgi:hypothetical protein